MLIRALYFASVSRLRGLQSSEPEWTLLSDLISSGDIVVDIGSNIGRYSLQMSRLVGPTGHVFAFDPGLESSLIFNLVMMFNRITNVTHCRLAISDKLARIGFELNTSKPSSAVFSTFPASRVIAADGSENYAAYSTPLDPLLLALPAISLIKIDIEGLELAALSGLSGILRKHKPTLIVENNDPNLKPYLQNLGYRISLCSQSSRNIIAKPV